MHNWPYAVGTVLFIFVSVEILFIFRSRQMRGLADRLGWSYTPAQNHVWKMLRRQKRHESDFWLRGDPMDAMWGAMNIIDGKQGDIRIVVLDSLLHFGPRYDRYVTFIGAKTESDPFKLRNQKEKLVHSNGWFGLYRMHFSVLTWSLSVKRIKQHIDSIGGDHRANPQPQP